MKKAIENILANVINKIPDSQYPDPKKIEYHKVCHEICQAASSIGHSFISIHEEMYVPVGGIKGIQLL